MAAHQDADFEGLYWYRLPLVFAIFSYYIYVAIAPMNHMMLQGLLVLLTFNACNMFFQVIRMFWAMTKILRAAGRRGKMSLLTKRHVFIIPNYKEPLHVLRNTLQYLARHAHSHTYTIVLAMESKEQDQHAKANTLIEEFRNSFDKVIHAVHVLQSHEMAGKASNVNSAVREVVGQLSGETMLTILDADAEVCENYITELDPISNMRDIFGAPVLFEQNFASTPMIVCVNDYIWSSMAIQNMNPFSLKIGFPMSAYSLSVNLAQRVGYWDTHPDAIGEDMHMFIKAYIKTKGECQLQFVPAPINMGHVEGNGYLGTIWARILQAERHMRGMADTAYVLKFMWQLGPLRGIQLMLQMFEAHLLPFIVINTMVYFPMYYMTFNRMSADNKTFELIVIETIGKLTIAMAVIILSFYEIIRNVTCKHMYNHKVVSYKWYYFPCYLILLISATPFMILPSIYVAIKHLLNVSMLDYYVAVKGSTGNLLAAAGGKE